MREKLNRLPFIAYHVETLTDGRKICITKPGGKQFWGVIQPNDFMVWIYDEGKHDRWRISHGEIYEDIELKLTANPELCTKFIDVLFQVCEGAEPDELKDLWANGAFSALPGFPAELLIKAYKWIWIQEDCNYPSGEGRWKSMNPILKLRSITMSDPLGH